jgi:hypothetical protein
VVGESVAHSKKLIGAFAAVSIIIMSAIKNLTKAEEQIMQTLWKLVGHF